MTIDLKHDIGDKVEIIPLECQGIVKSISITRRNIQYEVRYFDKAEAKSVYFYEEELKRR